MAPDPMHGTSAIVRVIGDSDMSGVITSACMMIVTRSAPPLSCAGLFRHSRLANSRSDCARGSFGGRCAPVKPKYTVHRKLESAGSVTCDPSPILVRTSYVVVTLGGLGANMFQVCWR